MNDIATVNAGVERLEAAMLPLPQVECPLEHRFTPGIYLREIFMPAGTLVVGHQHKTEHFNVVLCGRASVMMDGVVHHVAGPCVFASQPGVRKVLFIHEDMRWATVHPTTETNVEKLEEMLVEKSVTWLEHEDAKRLMEMLETKEELCHSQQQQLA